MKVSYILEYLEEIEGALPNPSGIVLKGVYFNLSSAIEAAIDMIAMLCKDLRIVPTGDYENIQSIQQRDLINEALAQALAKCNGLRNVLIHQYNDIDENLVLEAIPQVENALKEFIHLLEVRFDES